MLSIRHQNYSLTRILLGDFKVDVNYFRGRLSPLFIAIMKDNVDFIELLMQFGADVTIKNDDKINALDYGILVGSYKSVLFI